MTNHPEVSVPLTAFVLILSITGGCSTVKPTQANTKGASSKEAAVPVQVFAQVADQQFSWSTTFTPH